MRALSDTASAVDIEAAIVHHLDRKRRRGAAANTLRAYAVDLRQFAAYLVSRREGVLAALVTHRHIEGWLDTLSAQGVSARSQARKLTVVRGLFRTCELEGWIGHDPCRDVQVKFRRVLRTAPELPALYAMVEDIGHTHWRDLRDRALLRLALDAGLRISELLCLDMAGCGPHFVDSKRLLVHFGCKGGDSETSPINQRTATIVQDWIRVRGDVAAPGETALFVSRRGTRLTRQMAHVVVKQRGAAAGLPGLHMHLLRHRRIGDVIERCGLLAARELAHHSSAETTGSVYGRHVNTAAVQLLRERADLDRAGCAA